MVRAITVVIDDVEKTFEQPDGHENDGRVFELVREYIKSEHVEVMKVQHDRRLKEHTAAQDRIAEERRKTLGAPPAATSLTPDTAKMKTGAKGVN